MDKSIGFILLALLYACVGGAHGVCKHVRNDDMVEYHCVGGDTSDLYALPRNTGKIRIMDMHIPRITADLFSRFGSELWVLTCSHCGIEEIEENAFEELENLQQLSLDNNRLTTVKEAWFRGLDYLTFLDLNYNKIKSIEDGVFTNLPSLVDLRLSGNQLECLNLRDMSQLSELKRMFLSENSELKCPNAISNFLEDHGVHFEKDPEWKRIPTDLVKPFGEEPPTTVSSLRERLYTIPSTSVAPPRPTTTYSPTRYYPTEEIFYPPDIVTPSWASPEITPEPTRRTHYGEVRTPDTPPQKVSPSEMTYHHEPTPYHPPRENENKQYAQPNFPSEVTRPPLLAPSPTYRQETRFGEDDAERTTDPYSTYWTPNEDDLSFAAKYPVDDGISDYTLPVTEIPDDPVAPPHRIRPLHPSAQEEFQPSSPDDFFQAPYYEPTVTIRPPPLENYQHRQEETTLGVLTETSTTDKPLPECPNRSSQSNSWSLHLLLMSILCVVMRNILVEGF